jgi:hypothetical protein
LIQDQIEGAEGPLKQIHEAASALAERAGDAAAPAQAIAAASHHSPDDLKGMQDAFLEMSNALLELVKVAPPAGEQDLYHAYCPMLRKSWIQGGREISNPYSRPMRKCGTIREAIAASPAEEG